MVSSHQSQPNKGDFLLKLKSRLYSKFLAWKLRIARTLASALPRTHRNQTIEGSDSIIRLFLMILFTTRVYGLMLILLDNGVIGRLLNSYS